MRLSFVGTVGLLHVPFFIHDGKVEKPKATQYDCDSQGHRWSYNELNSNPAKQLLQRNQGTNAHVGFPKRTDPDSVLPLILWR